MSNFEKKYDISINVYGFRWEYNPEKEEMELLIFPLRLSKMEGNELKEVNLFYITQDRNEFKDKSMISNGESEFEIVSHYSLITSLSRLLSSTVRKNNNGKGDVAIVSNL